MFAKESNASKYAFISLAQLLKEKGFKIVDCQVHTAHLESLGAELIPIDVFQELLENSGNEKLHIESGYI